MNGGPPLLPAESQVLSTMKQDGSRSWLKPKLSKGKFLAWRRAVAYALIGLYTLLPFIHVDGEPLVLFDLPARRFIIFGHTFLPTDTALLALFMVGLFFGIFFMTALLGRVWCGWACPHTVYMEFLFRPIERFFDGTAGRGGRPRKLPHSAMLAARYATYAFVAFFLANTFLAYFVGVKELGRWMLQSPLEHPASFAVMAVVTGAMFFHFSYFREQLCILACPYGRLQSVLLDKNSVIVSYDAKRGEPRGKRRKSLPVVEQGVGDCVDCRLCVQTCPTGIDIRKGLQMECVHCTQCIDACDAVMRKLGRAPDLIRYSSQSTDAGRPRRFLRPRVVIYPLLIAAVAVAFFVVFAGKRSFDAVVLRNAGQPFTLTQDGDVRNILRLKATNRSEGPLAIQVSVLEPTGIEITAETISLDVGATETVPISALGEPDLFVTGQVPLKLQVRGDDGDTRIVEATLLGPQGGRG